MDIYRKWVDEPWRALSSVARGISIVVIVVPAYLVDHAVGGGTGFVAGLVVALLLMVLVPACWRAVQH